MGDGDVFHIVVVDDFDLPFFFRLLAFDSAPQIKSQHEGGDDRKDGKLFCFTHEGIEDTPLFRIFGNKRALLYPFPIPVAWHRIRWRLRSFRKAILRNGAESPHPNCIICGRFSSKRGCCPEPVDDQGAWNRQDQTTDFPGSSGYSKPMGRRGHSKAIGGRVAAGKDEETSSPENGSLNRTGPASVWVKVRGRGRSELTAQGFALEEERGRSFPPSPEVPDMRKAKIFSTNPAKTGKSDSGSPLIFRNLCPPVSSALFPGEIWHNTVSVAFGNGDVWRLSGNSPSGRENLLFPFICKRPALRSAFESIANSVLTPPFSRRARSTSASGR